MTGWRLGWLVMPASMTPHMGKLVEFNTSCAPVFIQRAGLVALQRTDDVTPQLVAHLKTCRDTLVPLLQAVPGVEVAPAKGGMYAFFRLADQSVSVIRWKPPSGWWSRPGWAWRREMPSWSIPDPMPRAGCAGVLPAGMSPGWGRALSGSGIGLRYNPRLCICS